MSFTRQLRIPAYVMRCLVLSLLLGFFIDTNAAAADYKINYAKQSFTFGIPEGYCYLDRSNQNDARYTEGLSKLLLKNNMKYLHGFLNCHDLQEMRLEKKFTGFRYGYVTVFKTLPGHKIPLDMSRAAFVNLIAKSITGDVWAQVEKNAKKLDSEHFKLSHMSRPQLLKIDDQAAYYGGANQYESMVGGLHIASVHAFSLIKGVPFVFYLYRPYHDVNTFKTLLSELKQYVEKSIAENEGKSVKADKPPQVKTAIAPPTSSAHFKTLKLVRGVSVEIPEKWWLRGEDYLQTVDMSAAAADDLSELGIKDKKAVNLIAAYATPHSAYASLRIGSIKPSGISREELEKVETPHLKAASILIQEKLRANLRGNNIELIDFYGLQTETINGRPALVMRYTQKGSNGLQFVEFLKIPAKHHEIHITFKYGESEKRIWLPVMKRVKSSIKIND